MPVQLGLKDCDTSSKIRLMCSLVTSIFLCACESCTLTAELQRRIQAMEMKCYRKILHVSYKDRVTKEEVRAKIQQAIGPQEDLTTVKRRKLQRYGHISSSSGLAKTILQGTVKGGRRQGGQRKRWEDNIRKWTGLEFAKSQRAVENRGNWKKLIENSSVVPQRPSRLRNRGDEVKSPDSCVMYVNTIGYPSGLGTKYLDLITAVN